MRAPTTNIVTQGKHGTYNAVDYAADPDPNIYAPEDGKITFYQNSGDCGNNLHLTAGGNVHGFCHLERATVSVGDQVKKGQVIGIMGYTGYTIPAGPNGRHLHWVIRQGSTYVYPPSLVNETVNQGGSEVASREQVNTIYKAVLMREGDPGGLANYTGRDANQIISEMINSNERKSLEQRYRDLETVLKQTQDALANEQNKPPKEVVKEVQVIVEKPVEVVKEVVVYAHDNETKENVKLILKIVQSLKGSVANLFKVIKGLKK